jgi:FSR family fosmidomycin resistance protein-like MFS transporter
MESAVAEMDFRKRTERRILFFTCAAHAMTHVYMVTLSVVLLPMCGDLGLSIADLTLYGTIGAVLYGLGALPAGLLSDRWGEKALLSTFFFLTAAGGTAVGLSRSPVLLSLGMGLMGLGASIFHPVGNSWIARGFRSPGRAMGINGLWGSLGEAAGPVAAAGISVLLSWRWAYLAYAVPMAVIGGWLMLSRAEAPSGPDAGPAGRPPAAPAAGSPAGREGILEGESSGMDRSISGRRRVLAFLFAAMICGGMQFWMVKTMLPTHVQAHTSLHGDSHESILEASPSDSLRGGYLTGLIYAIGGIGQYAVGCFVDRRDGRGVYCLLFAALAPLVYAVGRLDSVALIAAGSLMSILLFSVQPVENTLLARLSPRRWQGLIFGVKFVLTFGIGGFGTYLSGWVVARHGMTGVFTVASAFTMMALVLALFALAAGRDRGETGLGRGEKGARPASTFGSGLGGAME